MEIPNLPWREMLIGALGGGGAIKAAELIAKQGRNKAYTMGAVDHAVQTAMEVVTGQLERSEKRMGIIEDQNEDCERRLGALRTDFDAEKVRHRHEIDSLMAGRIAQPGEAAPC